MGVRSLLLFDRILLRHQPIRTISANRGGEIGAPPQVLDKRNKLSIRLLHSSMACVLQLVVTNLGTSLLAQTVHSLGPEACSTVIKAEARLGDLSDFRRGVVGESQPIAESAMKRVKQLQSIIDLRPDILPAHHLRGTS